jgi:hypothetical protein
MVLSSSEYSLSWFFYLIMGNIFWLYCMPGHFLLDVSLNSTLLSAVYLWIAVTAHEHYCGNLFKFLGLSLSFTSSIIQLFHTTASAFCIQLIFSPQLWQNPLSALPNALWIMWFSTLAGGNRCNSQPCVSTRAHSFQSSGESFLQYWVAFPH